ncbi:hypothetical protein NDU88_005355 [Pleurodeles waltl]|uniref:Uncharacterized protein n=1 Tax=Pleurodeles waltl TaxID=8319 RepID=A0AAV7QEP6_PLEWA|nr:hypothetical protein NDU88_005355 [Pleurodeles waltl]
MKRNPDIRVPDVIESEDGLHAARTFKNRDSEEGAAKSGDREETPTTRKMEEEAPNTSPRDTVTGQGGPEELEHRLVPGGTWLSQTELPD